MRTPILFETYRPLVNMIFSLVIVLLFVSCETDETQTVITLTNLTFEDDFDTDGPIDETSWSYELGDGTDNGLPAGWGNNEL